MALRSSRSLRVLVGLLGCAALFTAHAQRDLAGHWSQRFHEDLPERGAGPEIGDYTGLPINDAARLRADTWDAAKWTMPERQCEPHPADYGPRGPAALAGDSRNMRGAVIDWSPYHIPSRLKSSRRGGRVQPGNGQCVTRAGTHRRSTPPEQRR